MLNKNRKIVFKNNNSRLKFLYSNEDNININVDEHPYIANRYVTPTWDVNDEITLNFYVTDWKHSDKVHERKDINFEILVTVNDELKIYNVKIGDNSINIGKLPIGEYTYLLQAKDTKGRYSHELYNEFRVIDKVLREQEIDNNTYVVTDADLSKYNITKGSCVNDNETAHNTKMGIQNLMNDLSLDGVRKVVLPTATYTIDVEGKWATGVTVQYSHNVLSIPSNFILDLNGSTINQTVSPPDQKVGLMMAINDCHDSHVINGTLEGDWGLREFIRLEGHSYVPGEQGGCASISGDSKYSSFDNITVKKFCGYAMISGIAPQGLLASIPIKPHAIIGDNVKLEIGDIDEEGLHVESEIKYTSQYLDLAKFADINRIRIGQYLGFLYQPHGDSVIAKYHFYDEEKNFIKTVIGHQYRDIYKPNNAKYMKCTMIFDKFKNMDDLMLYHMYTPRNCEWNNITFEDTRTCGLAPYQGNNILINDCKFIRCASEKNVPGGEVTPVAIDFEDGWHNMQDYCLENCKVIEPVGTADLVIVGGFDLIMRYNDNFRTHSRGFCRGQIFKECTNVKHMQLGLTTHRMSAYAILENMEMLSAPNNGNGKLDDIKLIIEGCTFKKVAYQNGDVNVLVRNSVFDWDYHSLQFRSPILDGTFYNCTFNNYIWDMGHISNFNAYNCNINNMKLEALQGGFKLYGCKVEGCSFANYNTDIVIDIKDSILKDFNFGRISFTKCNINYTSKDSTFDNISANKNILGDSYSGFDNTKTFKVITSNNKYLNGTVLANDSVLNNPNIDFTEAL